MRTQGIGYEGGEFERVWGRIRERARKSDIEEFPYGRVSAEPEVPMGKEEEIASANLRREIEGNLQFRLVEYPRGNAQGRGRGEPSP